MSSPASHRRCIRASALAAYIGIHRETMAKWARQGVIAAWTPKRHYTDDRPRKTSRGVWRIWEADVRQFLRERRYRGPDIPAHLWER